MNPMRPAGQAADAAWFIIPANVNRRNNVCR